MLAQGAVVLLQNRIATVIRNDQMFQKRYTDGIKRADKRFGYFKVP